MTGGGERRSMLDPTTLIERVLLGHCAAQVYYDCH